MMMGGDPASTGNTISGGVQFEPVVQGRDVQASFHLPAATVALAQLPAPTAGFTGRDGELAVLTGLLNPAGSAGPVVVLAVAGLAGWARPRWLSRRGMRRCGGSGSAAGCCSST
jgi:hypothetical protein